ncbi:hypothetical protein ACOSP7_003624 [Xanthoceras sorbifolium]
MYASPLAIVKKIITTKSLDLYILISNGLGAIFGLIQLVIYACYYRKTLKSEDVVKLPEVQLSGAIRCAPERKPAGNPNY